MKRKNESGVVVVEAAIVVTVVTVFIAVMLYIGMLLYQQSLVQVTATQTASNIAQIYGNTSRDVFTGYTDVENVQQTVTYANVRNQAYKTAITQKAEAAALYRLKSSGILTNGETAIEVNVVPKPNELLKDQVVVKVTDIYKIPFVSFFGVKNNTLEFEATGRADCTDLLAYLTGVPALGTGDGNAAVFSDECTVNFYKHYGDHRPLKTVTVLRGNSVNASTDYSHSTMPETPTQEKMRFTKWVTEDWRTFTGDSTVNEDMNIYGNWECNVKFDPDGGVLENTESDTVAAIVNGNIDLPTATREGCTFAGWYTEKNGEGEKFTGFNVQSDITVYAKWVCTVMFYADGGSVLPNSVNIVYGKTFAECGFTLPIPSRNGCRFDGWFESLYGDGQKFGNGTAVKAHQTVYAKWLCTVTLVPQGGKLNNTNLTAVVGKTCSATDPTAPYGCWKFTSWNFNSDGTGNEFLNNETVITGPTTVYARWSVKHVYGKGEELKRAANCKERAVWKHTCKYCKHAEEYSGGFGNHRFEGRCGVLHPLGNDAYKIANHSGDEAYEKTTYAECVLCVHCGAGWDGVTHENNVEYAGTTERNGVTVSIGMYCRKHIIGEKESDDKTYSKRKKITPSFAKHADSSKQ